MGAVIFAHPFPAIQTGNQGGVRTHSLGYGQERGVVRMKPLLQVPRVCVCMKSLRNGLGRGCIHTKWQAYNMCVFRFGDESWQRMVFSL